MKLKEEEIIGMLDAELVDAHFRIYEGTDIDHEAGDNNTGERCTICEVFEVIKKNSQGVRV